jgi:major membrane immunogen (membrane-anchored lipoprotein)
MKKALGGLLVTLVLLGACTTTPVPVGKSKAVLGQQQILPYEHIDGFGTRTDSPGWIAWEFEAQGYVKYQITYTSCTCRQESINVKSLLYVEITKQGPASRIKRLMFNYWGDSPVTPAGNTREQIEENYMKKLAGLNKSNLDSVDVIAGATVTTVNLRQISAAILDYHVKNYPTDSGIEVEITPDALTGATVS